MRQQRNAEFYGQKESKFSLLREDRNKLYLQSLGVICLDLY